MSNAGDKPVVTLLPCPWCQSAAQTSTFHAAGLVWAQASCENDKCAVTGPCGDTEAEAITAWNTRHREQDTLSREGREAELEAIVASFVGALTGHGRNRDNMLSIDHDVLRAIIAHASAALSRSQSPEQADQADVLRERVWEQLKARCCADRNGAKRCIMVSKDDLLAALTKAQEG